MQGIGLAGAHRSGKTTLATMLASSHSIYYLASPASKIYEDLGFEVGEKLELAERYILQRNILDKMKQNLAITSKKEGSFFIADRTPLDVASYMLADLTMGPINDDFAEKIAKFVEECIEVTLKYYKHIIFVPPFKTNKLTEEEGKLAGDLTFQSKISYLIYGLLKFNFTNQHYCTINELSTEGKEERLKELTGYIAIDLMGKSLKGENK